jgi:hypothetical protein
MGAGALAPGRVCTEFPKDKEFRAFEMLEKIELSSKPGRCDRRQMSLKKGNNLFQDKAMNNAVRKKVEEYEAGE